MIELNSNRTLGIDINSKLGPNLLKKIGFIEDEDVDKCFFMGNIQVREGIDITGDTFYVESHLQSWGINSETWKYSKLYTFEDMLKYFGNKLIYISKTKS